MHGPLQILAGVALFAILLATLYAPLFATAVRQARQAEALPAPRHRARRPRPPLRAVNRPPPSGLRLGG